MASRRLSAFGRERKRLRLSPHPPKDSKAGGQSDASLLPRPSPRATQRDARAGRKGRSSSVATASKEAPPTGKLSARPRLFRGHLGIALSSRARRNRKSREGTRDSSKARPPPVCPRGSAFSYSARITTSSLKGGLCDCYLIRGSSMYPMKFGGSVRPVSGLLPDPE